jgi:transmembrane sensor
MSRIDMDELFDRYLKGEATPGEAEQVEAWLNRYQNPESEWQQMDPTSREQWLDKLFVDIQSGTGADKKVVKLNPKSMIKLAVALAAAAVVLLFAGVYLLRPKPAGLVALNIGANQHGQAELPDGSKIWVNSLSSVTYPKEFKGETREISLSGEAYFDIKHDPSKPFIIHTGNVVTTVLGTAFNIKEDKLLHIVVVTVTRGKVSVANGSRLLGVITPNQQISFNTASRQLNRTSVDAAKTIAWQTDTINFNNITLAAAARQLEQRFGVKITFANDKVKNCRFTGSALSDEKLDNILKAICTFNNATYQTRADGSIVIDGPGCD